MAARSTARNLSAISAHKAAQLAGAFGFAALVPRLLGPELFGQLAFVLSLSLLLQMLGDLGGMDLIGRNVPGWTQQGEEGQQHIAWLVWQLTWVRLGLGMLATLVLVLLAPWLAPWLTPLDGLLVGLGVAVRMLSWTPYHLSFGLNQMGRWSVELSYRQIVLIPCLLIFASWGLTGLLVGNLLAEMVFLVPGLAWTRPYWRVQAPDLAGLRPFLRFGAGFFAANAVLVLLYRSGPVLLELLTRDTVAVGYLSLALSIYMLLITILSQYMAAFIPTLSLFHTRHQDGEAQRWLERLMRFSAVLMGILVIGIILLTHPVAPLLFGKDFQPVSRVFLLLSLPLVAQPLVWAGRYAATAFGHPRVAFVATLAGLVVALAASLLLMPPYAANGAALAMGAGIMALGGALFVLGRGWLRPPWRAWLLTYLPLLFLAPLYSPGRSLAPSLILTAVAMAAYLALLWLLRVLPTTELRQAAAAFRPH